MLKQVMGLINKINEKPKTAQIEGNNSNLTQSEIQFLLNTLRECTFKGNQVVDLYNTVLKLQQQYKDLDK